MIVHNDFCESANRAQSQEDSFENTLWVGLSQLKPRQVEGNEGCGPQVCMDRNSALGSLFYTIVSLTEPSPTYLSSEVVITP